MKGERRTEVEHLLLQAAQGETLALATLRAIATSNACEQAAAHPTRVALVWLARCCAVSNRLLDGSAHSGAAGSGDVHNKHRRGDALLDDELGDGDDLSADQSAHPSPDQEGAGQAREDALDTGGLP